MKILLLMILFHIIDDFVLQPVCLAKLKQQSWWKENAPEEMYCFDYVTALLIHALSWSIMILVPPMFVKVIPGYMLLLLVVTNTTIHAIVDDCKANKKTINLTRDQLIHFFQIFFTWTIIYLI